MLEEPPAHRGEKHAADKEAGEPVARETSVDAANNRTDGCAGNGVVKEERTIVVALLVVPQVIENELIAESDGTATQHVGGDHIFHPSVSCYLKSIT